MAGEEHRDRIVGTVRVPTDRLSPHPKNWRTHGDFQRETLRGSLADLGVSRSLSGVPADPKEQARLRRLKTREAREKWCREFEAGAGRVLLLDGHLRREEVRSKLVPVELLDLDEREQAEFLATLDPIGALAGADRGTYLDLARDFSSTEPAVQQLVARVAAMEAEGGGASVLGGSSGDGDGGGSVLGGGGEPEARATLAERFGVPPFSVLNAREGWWQSRKAAWIALGLRSELGRGGQNSANATPGGSTLPAAKLEMGKTVRGDGRGRKIVAQ